MIRSILRKLPIIGKRIQAAEAAAEQARLEAEAKAAAERFFEEWNKKSLDECIQACGFSSEAEARQAARFILGDI